MRRIWILHPFLFALYGALALLARNKTLIRFEAWRSLALSLLLSILLLLLIRLLVRDWTKAGLVTSSFILLIFSYGHLKNLTRSLSLFGVNLGQDLVLLPLSLLALILWVRYVLRMAKNPSAISSYLNWVSLILIIFPLVTIIRFAKDAKSIEEWADIYLEAQLDRYQVSDILDHPPAKPDDLPDILYIVVDAYSREDILAELYAYDNSAFVRFLEDHGFYVTRGARANYADTEFSIASSLNMIHIDTLPQYLYENAGINTLEGIKQVAGELVRKNALLDILHTFGYEVVGFESGFGATQVEKIDLWMAPPEEEEINFWQLSFEIMLLDSSLADTFLKFRKADGSPLQRVFDLHRTRILYTLDNLPKSIDGDGPRFVYAHIISPHTPFVFGPNGEELEAENPFTLMDADPGGEGNINYYRDQVHFLNSRLEEVIPQILDHRSRPLMIILQSDHGGKVYQGPAPDTEKRMKLLLPILSAYYVPQLEESAFYPTLTPVNEFRIILNDLFGTDLERLEDTSYLLENIDGVYQFVDGCKLYDACPTR